MQSDWLLTEILAGMQRLALLRLANAPATAEAMTGCAMAWMEVLEAQRGWHLGERDGIREAFRTLMARTPQDGRPVFWPAPGDLIALMTPASQVPYHQPFAIEWDQHEAKNRSLTAKAHVTFNAARLECPVPAWAMPDDEAESAAILRMVGAIKAEEAEQRRLMAQRRAAA